MRIDWTLCESEPPLHTGLPCLVCTTAGHIHIAEYHSEPERWLALEGSFTENEIYDVMAYIYLRRLPLPSGAMHCVITNDKWIENLAKAGLLKRDN